MKLIIVLFFVCWTSVVMAQGLPPEIAQQIQSQTPEVRKVLPVDALTVLVALYYSEANIWVLTYMHMVAPDKWSFKVKDIIWIMAEKGGIVQEIWKQAEGI